MEKNFMALGSHPKCNLNAILWKLQSKGISCFILQLYIVESKLLQILNCLVKVWSLLLLPALFFLGSFQLGKNQWTIYSYFSHFMWMPCYTPTDTKISHYVQVMGLYECFPPPSFSPCFWGFFGPPMGAFCTQWQLWSPFLAPLRKSVCRTRK